LADSENGIAPEIRVQLEQLAFEREKSVRHFQLAEMRIKWISGVVAIVLAIVAALGGWMSGLFGFVIDKYKLDRDISDQESKWQKSYIDSYIEYALDKDLSNRRDFALYVHMTSETGEFKSRWKEYYEEIVKQIEKEENTVSNNISIIKNLDEFRDYEEISILRSKNDAILKRIQGVGVSVEKNYIVPPKSEIEREKFFSCIREEFEPSLDEKRVDAYENIFTLWDSRDSLVDVRWLAYFLATIRAEVGAGMRPVREGFAKSDEEARKVLAGRAYAESVPPYGHAYYGRGYILLTWFENYKKIGENLSIDLVQYPDQALMIPVAFDIMVNGMMNGSFNSSGKGLSEYINTQVEDVVNARRTVNVLDRAQFVAEIYYKYKKCLN